MILNKTGFLNKYFQKVKINVERFVGAPPAVHGHHRLEDGRRLQPSCMLLQAGGHCSVDCIPEYGDFSTAEIGSHRLMNIFLIFSFFSAENQ